MEKRIQIILITKNTVNSTVKYICYNLNSCLLCKYIVTLFISVIKAVFSASLLQSLVSHDLQKSF